jgi:hypothetical protein
MTDPRPHEEDVNPDDGQALSRATGGVEDPDAPDQGSTTGTTPTEEYVGRIAGQDVGYAGEQGGERATGWTPEKELENQTRNEARNRAEHPVDD